MTTKIAFVSPFAFLREDFRFTPYGPLNDMLKKYYRQHLLRRPNLALLTLASYLDDSYEIDYLDEQYQEINFEKHYDIVAISIMTVNSYRGYEIADQFRKNGSHVIIGGMHATLAAAEAKEHADTVVVGEAEDAWQKFLKDYKQGTPQPFYDGGSVNLDESPHPRLDLVPRDYYYSTLFKKEVYSFQYSRGCPHRCSFCASSKAYGKKYRTKSIDHFTKGVEQALERSKGDCMIFFADDDITINKKTAKDLFDRLAEYKITWGGCADIAISDDVELLDKMAKAGCHGVIMGLESLDAKILETIDPFKARYFKNYDESVSRVMEHGVPILASFIVGFDGDDRYTLPRMYEFIKKHKIPMASFSMLVPFPGTAVLHQLQSEGRLFYKDFWDKCTGVYPLFEPKQISSEDLTEGIYWITSQLAKERTCKSVRM